MKNHFKLSILFTMEIKRFWQNRKQIVCTFFVPPMVLCALLYGMVRLTGSSTMGSIAVYGASAYPELLEDNGCKYPCVFYETEFLPEQQKKWDKNKVVISVSEEEIQILYDSSTMTNSTVLHEAKCLADNILAMQIQKVGYPEYLQRVNCIRVIETEQPSEYLENVLLPLFGALVMISLMIINMSIGSLTTEALTTERTSGFLDLLLLSGTPIRSIVMEKYLFAALISFLLLMLQGIVLLLGFRCTQPELYLFFSEGNTGVAWIFPMLGCLVAMALFLPAPLTALGFFGKNGRNTFSGGILQLIMSMLAYLPNFMEDKFLNYLPISNLSRVWLAVAQGEKTARYVGGSFLISVLSAALLLFAAEKALKRSIKE